LIAEKTAMAKQAQYDATIVDLDLRQIKAPFRGQVVEILKKRGEWVQSGEAICHFVGLDRVRISGFVTATEGSPHELIDKPVEITVFAAGNKKHIVKGKIGFASPVIEGSGGTQFRVWTEVDNEKIVDSITKQESWKVQPGTMATMKIDLTPPAPKPIVSTKADPTKSGKTTPATTTGTQSGAKTTVPESKTTSSGTPPTGTKTTTPEAKTAPLPGKTTPAVGGKTESLKPVTPGESKGGSNGKKEETKSTAGASKDSKER